MSSRFRTGNNFRNTWVKLGSGREFIIPFPSTCKKRINTLATDRVISQSPKRLLRGSFHFPCSQGSPMGSRIELLNRCWTSFTVRPEV